MSITINPTIACPFYHFQSEIVKAYRKLAKKWHPDMHKSKEDKETASAMFLKIANAYEGSIFKHGV